MKFDFKDEKLYLFIKMHDVDEMSSYFHEIISIERGQSTQFGDMSHIYTITYHVCDELQTYIKQRKIYGGDLKMLKNFIFTGMEVFKILKICEKLSSNNIPFHFNVKLFNNELPPQLCSKRELAYFIIEGMNFNPYKENGIKKRYAYILSRLMHIPKTFLPA